jgi:hypothetical protein
LMGGRYRIRQRDEPQSCAQPLQNHGAHFILSRADQASQCGLKDFPDLAWR